MRIYFAGSIRAGRADVYLYKQIITHLKTYGEVLTEHVGDYSLSIAGQNQLPDKFIHDRDIQWLNSSDLVVAEVTVASLGVGYEIAMALKAGIKVIALFRDDENKQLSAMIAGSDKIKKIYYNKEKLNKVLDEIDILIKENVCIGM